jgi:hypothetical protein
MAAVLLGVATKFVPTYTGQHDKIESQDDIAAFFENTYRNRATTYLRHPDSYQVKVAQTFQFVV